MNLFKSYFLILFFIVGILSTPLAAGAESQQLLLQKAAEHLEGWRVPEAAQVIAKLDTTGPESLAVLDLQAQLAFYEGNYAEAFTIAEKGLAIESASEERQTMRLLAQRTRDAIGKLKRFESEHFVLFLDEQQDGILVPWLLDGLEKTYKAIGKELGYYPSEKVRVEIAPDVSTFNAISTLSLRDIEETGAVGICKFNKVMAISPRTLTHGYRWLDSLSHEYLHYVIVALSDNKAPIWLHEGIARFYETRWRQKDGSDPMPDYLTPSSQTLLARALKSNDLVPFEKMEPSLIYLETPQQVQLAYAEAASTIDYITQQKGAEGIQNLLAGLRNEATPEAVQTVMAVPFDQFETQWKDFLKAKGLKEVEGSRVRKLKVRGEGKENEESVELKEIQSVVARNRTHLADRLWARGRTVAASAEYRRALKASPHSPIILNRLGRVLTDAKKYRQALPYLKRAQKLDPDYVGTYVQMGRLYHAIKEYPPAKVVLAEAIQINPYDPTIHRLLFEIHTSLGETQEAEKSKANLQKLLRQG
ncbi:MAG: tetratricopeptide repeat protein [Deltaproteobacteria bacterium]|nr:tetratricopeptide repeat protein [Deltaproteobacteria bacterium]